MRSRPTIVDVAETAGVAVGTASNALSGKGRVSAATRARVAKVAAELGFVPHRAARGLPTGRTMSIGIRFGHDATIPGGDFFVEMLDAAAQTADDSGYGLLLRRSGRPETDLVDAHIVVDPLENDLLVGVEREMPVVTVGRNRAPSVPWVDVDHEAAMGALLEHLAGRAGDGPAWFVTLPQHLGFVDALEGAFNAWTQRNHRAGVVVRSPDTSHDVVASIGAALAASGPPALLATALDRQAVGAQHALITAGLAIPVGSASDGDALRLINPPVSAMALDGAAHGRAAVEMVMDWLRTGEIPGNRLLPAHLRAR